MNDLNEHLNKLILSLKENIGNPFASEQELDSHLLELLNSDDQSIGLRASTLFALWSNIYYLLGDDPVVNADSIRQIYLLRDYRFSIYKELGSICSHIISEEVGYSLKIDTLEKEKLFEELLKEVDSYIRANRMPDGDAIPFLLNVLHKHLFKLGD